MDSNWIKSSSRRSSLCDTTTQSAFYYHHNHHHHHHHHHYHCRQSPLRESTSREGSAGPDRPSTLTIPTLASALPKLSRFKREAQYGSLPRVKGGHKVPKINFQNMSVPTTPADSWGRGEGEYMMHQRDLSSSVSSVEEATEAVVTPRSKSKSRLSLNLGVFDSVSLGPGSPARSPRFLPKFLRSSFSKLMQSKDRTPEPPAAMEPMSLPFFSSVLSRSRCPTPEEDEPVEESPPSSPTTKTFVEESLAKGLPIIPFNYPTFVIVEKKISDAKAHQQAASPLPGPPLFSSWGATEKKETRSVSAPTSRKTSRLEGRSAVGKMGQSVDDKSLSSVVSMAKQEMEEEKQEGSLRKVRSLVGGNVEHGVMCSWTPWWEQLIGRRDVGEVTWHKAMRAMAESPPNWFSIPAVGHYSLVLLLVSRSQWLCHFLV